MYVRRPGWVDSLRPSDVILYHWFWFGAKPLSEPKRDWLTMGPHGTDFRDILHQSNKLSFQYDAFENGGHFYHASVR